jgi:uncharacterized protein
MRSRRALLAAGAASLLLPAAADAHVSLHPNTIPAGAFATVDVRVPGEQAGAHVTGVDMLFPPGFTSAAYANVPGWTTAVAYQRLPRPIQTDDGPVDTEVSQIHWRWAGPAGRVDDNTFINLPLSLAIPAGDEGRSLAFKTVQTYSNGQVVHWIGPPDADTPAPTINITTPGGMIEDVGGAEAGPAPGQVPTGTVAAKPASSSGASRGLAIAALVVGLVGVVVGVAALLSVRHRVRR